MTQAPDRCGPARLPAGSSGLFDPAADRLVRIVAVVHPFRQARELENDPTVVAIQLRTRVPYEVYSVEQREEESVVPTRVVVRDEPSAAQKKLPRMYPPGGIRLRRAPGCPGPPDEYVRG